MSSKSSRSVLVCAFVFSLIASSFSLPKPQPETSDSQLAAARIQRVENGIPPISLGPNEAPIQLSLPELMKIYKVLGLSVAVVDNFKIAWAKAYGVTEAGATTPVT
ncbi:MAG: hypothetical protein WBX03_13545, partial [Terriglobales bacterium]